MENEPQGIGAERNQKIRKKSMSNLAGLAFYPFDRNKFLLAHAFMDVNHPAPIGLAGLQAAYCATVRARICFGSHSLK